MDKKDYNMYSLFPYKRNYDMYVYKDQEKPDYNMYSDAVDIGGMLLLPCHHDDYSHLSVIDPKTGKEICSSHGLDSDSIDDHMTHIHKLLEEGGMNKAEKPFHGYNKKKHSKSGGLSDSYRKKYNRETGSNLKRPVTGKVKPGSEAAKRRKSFCARMSGTPGKTSKDGKLTPKGAALKRWKCSKSENLEKRCWEGYKPTPGKKPYEKGSCMKKKLEHYSSQQGLSEIDPAHQGKGVDVTARRSTAHPHSFYYRAGTEPENIVASQARSKYSIDIPEDAKLYDLSTDQEGHVRQAIEENQGALNMDLVHEKLKNQGYHGFYASKHPHGLENVVALYHSQPVSSEEKIRE